MITKGTNQIILEANNANPSCKAVAIENFLQLDGLHKVMVLGDMFELGTESFQEYKANINLLLGSNEVTFYFVGKKF